MLELPEAAVIAQQLNETIKNKRIMNVTVNKSPHKFAWFFGDPQEYHDILYNRILLNARNYSGLIEISTDSDLKLLFGDGVSLAYYNKKSDIPKKHQLDIEFEDETHIIAKVQMYGGIWAFREGQNENPYYKVAKEKPNPLSEGFSRDYFEQLVSSSSEKLSLKAFLATEQRIPGLGNGVLQDILFNAALHPKRKINSLSEGDKDKLFNSVKETLTKMTFEGGRDTERDLFDCSGGYITKLSKNTVNKPCTICGSLIKKESYMGGSIYLCEVCQKI